MERDDLWEITVILMPFEEKLYPYHELNVEETTKRPEVSSLAVNFQHFPLDF